MLVPELPYKTSSPEEALACLRKIANLIDKLHDKLCSYFNEMRSHLNKVHEKNQKMLQNFKLQIQPQSVSVSDISLSKVTYQKIFGNSISRSETSLLWNLPQVIKLASCQRLNISKSETSCLRTQTWFVTPLSYDLESDITKPTSSKIVVSAKTKPSESGPSIFRKRTQLTKVEHFHQLIRKLHQLMPQTWNIVVTEGIDGVAEDKISKITQSTSEDSIHKYEMSRHWKTTQMIEVGSCHQLIPRTWQIV